MRRAGRTHAMWEAIKTWCMENPSKKAAIVMPQGTFVISFEPKETESADDDDPTRFVGRYP